MRSVVMISPKKGFDLPRQFRNLLRSIFEPAQTFTANGSVETLDVALLILLVGTRNSVPVTVNADRLGKLRLEFRASTCTLACIRIGLNEPHPAVKATGHTRFQKSQTIFGS